MTNIANKIIGGRLKEVRLKKKKKGVEFASMLKISDNSNLSKIEKGERAIPPKSLLVLYTELGVNKEWLETGKGKMFNNVNDQSLKTNENGHRKAKVDIPTLDEINNQDMTRLLMMLQEVISTNKELVKAQNKLADSNYLLAQTNSKLAAGERQVGKAQVA